MQRRAFLLSLLAAPIALSRLGRFTLDTLDFSGLEVPYGVPYTIGADTTLQGTPKPEPSYRQFLPRITK